MNKDKIIETMAKAVYDRVEGLKGVWAPRESGLCDVYYDTAEAALQALLQELKESPSKSGLWMAAFNAGAYQQLLNMRGE